MADADTIIVLDGIMHQKETTSDVYTQDHATNSSVYQNQIHIPLAYKAARVIYNGAYDPDGGRVHYRTKLLRTTSISTPTKTANQEDAWLALTPPAVAASSDFDVSASWDSIISIDVCQSSTTANTTGIDVIVQGRKEDSVDEWTVITRINVLAFSAVATKSDFAAQEAVAQTILSITDPTTGNLHHLGKFVFLEDTATINNSEIAFVVECGADS